MKRRSIHVHCPSGAIPKDGPSSGLAQAVALISLFSGKAVPPTMAMTVSLFSLLQQWSLAFLDFIFFYHSYQHLFCFSFARIRSRFPLLAFALCWVLLTTSCAFDCLSLELFSVSLVGARQLG